MSQTKKWTVKDVITTVLLSVLLILIQLVVNMVCMVNDFVSMDAVGRFHYAVVCADLFPHGQPCTSTGCFLRLHDHFGDRFSHYGELVSIALLYGDWCYLRSYFMEKRNGNLKRK